MEHDLWRDMGSIRTGKSCFGVSTLVHVYFTNSDISNNTGRRDSDLPVENWFPFVALISAQFQHDQFMHMLLPSPATSPLSLSNGSPSSHFLLSWWSWIGSLTAIQTLIPLFLCCRGVKQTPFQLRFLQDDLVLCSPRAFTQGFSSKKNQVMRAVVGL